MIVGVVAAAFLLSRGGNNDSTATTLTTSVATASAVTETATTNVPASTTPASQPQLTSPVIPTVVIPTTVVPTVVVSTALPTLPPPPPTTLPPPTSTPLGPVLETRCVRSNIDFAAVREAPGITEPEVGRIPPSTCDVQVYAVGSDGRIAWLLVAVGDISGWSAESNFV